MARRRSALFPVGSSDQLNVRLDRRDGRYRVGDEIRVEVVVSPSEDIRCRALTVKLVWETRGAGNTDRGTLATHVERDLHWVAGRDFTYSFCFPAPRGPFTYRGHHLHVEHHVRVKADLAWADDLEEEEGYVLLPGPGSRADFLAELPRFANSGDEESVLTKAFSSLMRPLIYLILALVMPLAFVMASFEHWAEISWKRFSEWKLGKVFSELDAPLAANSRGKCAVTEASRETRPWKREIPFAIGPGAVVPFRVRLEPRKAVVVNKVAIMLIGREHCTSGDGKGSVIHTHEIYEKEVVLADSGQYYSGQRIELHADVVVPVCEAYTFESWDNRVEWELAIHIDVPRWPDWTETLSLRYLPA